MTSRQNAIRTPTTCVIATVPGCRCHTVGVWKTGVRVASSRSPRPAELPHAYEHQRAITSRYGETVSRRSPTHRADASQLSSPVPQRTEIALGLAALTWMVGWVGGNIAGSLVLVASGDAKIPASERPVWLSAGLAFALWTPQLAALLVASRAFASGRPLVDYSLRFAPRDLLGIPIGVLSQLVLLRALYWPLQRAWPDTFGNSELERNARELYDRAHGLWIVVLVFVVVVGAPIVEELVYRGLLQGAARRTLNDVLAVVVVAAFFTVIHFRPVEYPGLFLFGLVLGSCAWATNRLGMGIVAHMSFNATALILVAR